MITHITASAVERWGDAWLDGVRYKAEPEPHLAVVRDVRAAYVSIDAGRARPPPWVAPVLFSRLASPLGLPPIPSVLARSQLAHPASPPPGPPALPSPTARVGPPPDLPSSSPRGVCGVSHWGLPQGRRADRDFRHRRYLWGWPRARRNHRGQPHVGDRPADGHGGVELGGVLESRKADQGDARPETVQLRGPLHLFVPVIV